MQQIGSKTEIQSSPTSILGNKLAKCLTCLMFSLSDGGIISGERLCGGSRPLLSFWLIRWSARANCSRVSFPMSPMSHSSLGRYTDGPYIRVNDRHLGQRLFLMGRRIIAAIAGAAAPAIKKGCRRVIHVEIKINAVTWMCFSLRLHALQSCESHVYYTESVQASTRYLFLLYRVVNNCKCSTLVCSLNEQFTYSM